MALVEHATGPMIAILFWIVILLMVLMTVARGKVFEANIFEVIGAIGQVIFAAAVFDLGRQQFRFTQKVTARQHKIDTFAHRIKLLEEYMDMKRRFFLKNFEESVPIDFARLSTNIEFLFSREVNNIAHSLGEALFDLSDIIENLREVTDPDEVDRESAKALRNQRAACNKVVRKLGSDLIQAMRKDLRLDLD